MPYIPRGFVTTVEAARRLFEVKYPDLAANHGVLLGERQRLLALRRDNDPLLSPPTVAFTPEDRRRLQEVEASIKKIEILVAEIFEKIHAALAEGDLQSILQMKDGARRSIDPPRWRAEDGLDGIRSGCLSYPTRWGTDKTLGTVLIKEMDLVTWVSSGQAEREDHTRGQAGIGSANSPREAASSKMELVVPIQEVTPRTNVHGGEEVEDVSQDEVQTVRETIRPFYSAENLRAWFILRVRTWPKDKPSPTERQDMTEAKRYFAGRIPRDEFREIRRAKVPSNWRKPGPPSGR